MARFEAIDLSRLPALPLGQDTHEAILAARMADVADRLNAAGIPYNVTSLKTDTVFITENAGAFRELAALTRRDDAIRAVLLATAWGEFLDALGAAQVPPVARRALVESPRPYVYGTDSVNDWQDDDSFRRLIQLAPEALSTCGPEGAYLFFALASPGVKVAAVHGPESYGGTYERPFVGLGQVRVPIVATAGDGTASDALVAAVQAELRADDRRPIADFVTVSPALIVPYTIEAKLTLGPGADAALVRAEALKRLSAQAARQHRPGASVLRSALYGAAYVTGASGVALVDRVELAQPAEDVNAASISPTRPDGAFCAPYCTGITLTVEISDG